MLKNNSRSAQLAPAGLAEGAPSRAGSSGGSGAAHGGESTWGCGNALLRGCGGGGVAPVPLQGRAGAAAGLARAGTAGARVLDPGGWRRCASTEGRRHRLCLFSYRAFHRRAKIRHLGSVCVNISGYKTFPPRSCPLPHVDRNNLVYFFEAGQRAVTWRERLKIKRRQLRGRVWLWSWNGAIAQPLRISDSSITLITETGIKTASR